MKHIIKSCCFVTNDIWMYIHVLLKYVNILHLQVKKNVYYLKRQWFIVLNIIFVSGSGTIGYIYNQISVKLWILRIKKKNPAICLTKSLQSIRKRKLIMSGIEFNSREAQKCLSQPINFSKLRLFITYIAFWDIVNR